MRETVFKLERAKLIELIMINPIFMVVAVLLTALIGHHVGTSFAMHDSNLDVNTWLASDNSTQLNTIDLNSGPMASAAGSGGAAETGDEAVEDETGDEAVEGEQADEETDETDETDETPEDENENDEGE
jgi:hypothetical protein